MPKTYLGAILCASLAIATGACSSSTPVDPDAAPQPPDRSLDTSPVPDTAVFSETAVFRAADGTFQVERRQITAAEERAQNAARAEYVATGRTDLLVEDTGCGSASLWLYDRANQVGNRICFKDVGFADLRGYMYTACSPLGCTTTSWALSSGSLWSGTDYGYLYSGDVPYITDARPGEFMISFEAYQKESFDTNPTHLYWVVLGRR